MITQKKKYKVKKLLFFLFCKFLLKFEKKNCVKQKKKQKKKDDVNG